MLTFIAEYPNEANIRDGMMIRIKEIDNKHAHIQRCYLDISFFRPRNKDRKPTIVSEKLTIYRLNFFFDILLIYRLLTQAKQVYIHSLYNYIKVMPFLHLVFAETPVAIDLHGAIPEELKYHKSIKQSWFYTWVEQFAFKRVNYFIHVTHAMRKHFLKKYPANFRQRDFKDFVLGIFTSYDSQMDESSLKKIKEDLKWEESQIWFIYSGGVQIWQNIPLMLEAIKGLSDPNYRFLFLTGAPEKVKEWVQIAKMEHKVLIRSVAPSQLKEYYFLSNYGFVLRDRNVVNQVSNPTKLGEYLAYGLFPIVLEAGIGDYLDMGYEYLVTSELTDGLPKNKSLKNIDVYAKYLHNMKDVRLPFDT